VQINYSLFKSVNCKSRIEVGQDFLKFLIEKSVLQAVFF
jgi:hypothetical protein